MSRSLKHRGEENSENFLRALFSSVFQNPNWRRGLQGAIDPTPPVSENLGLTMPTKKMDAKRKALLERIKSIEQDICKAREYLESGKHANWSGFRPLFHGKFKDGEELPPHKDWVKNVFLPRKEKALKRAEKLVELFE